MTKISRRISLQQRRALGLVLWRGAQVEKKVVYEPIHTGEKRKHIVREIINILVDWRQSPFENEASCRFGLRSSLCLKGYAWQRADMEAAAIVAEGLRQMGAKRPSYDEGQWEYTIARENCAWCSCEIDDEGRSRGERFCSPVCAKSATVYRGRNEAWRHTEISKSARYVIERSNAPVRQCRYCEKSFQSRSALWASNLERRPIVYCSVACSDADKIIHAKRPCDVCGTIFKPGSADQRLCSMKCNHVARIKGPNRECRQCGIAFRSYRIGGSVKKGFYCSVECRILGGPTTIYNKACAWCSKEFITRDVRSMYCGSGCKSALQNIRTGKWKPKILTPMVFDYYLKVAA